MLSRHFQGLVAALALLSVCPPSSAFFSTPTVAPANPTPSDVISITVSYGECDQFYGSTSPISVTQNGSILRVVVPSVHVYSMAFCIFEDNTITYRTTSFPPGSYSLQIDRTYTGFLGDQIVETVATIPFTVTGAPPQEVPIPTLGAPALILLALGLFFLTRKRLAPFPCVALLLAGEDVSAQIYNPPASAFVSPPVLVPSSPMAGEVLAIDVTADTCDAFLGSTTPIPVTQNGSDLRVVLPSLHDTNILFCNYGHGTGRYVISSFQAGTYTLQIDRSYSTVFGTVTEPLATVPLVVRGVAQETPIPATSPLALLVLAAGLVLIATRRKFVAPPAAILFVCHIEPSAAPGGACRGLPNRAGALPYRRE